MSVVGFLLLSLIGGDRRALIGALTCSFGGCEDVKLFSGSPKTGFNNRRRKLRV